MRCAHCKTPLPPHKAQCTLCKQWNTVAQEAIDTKPVALSDVEPDLDEDRLSTDGLCDVVFGGGIVRDSTNLLGGQPGAGKSTLTLQIANVIAGMVDDEQDENELGKIYARTLYISAEEKLGAIGARAVRLQLPNRGRIMMVDALKKQEDDEGEEIEFDVDTIENHVVDIQPRLFIVDSLAELANGFAAQVVFCKRLKEIATENNCPALIIQHVNKKKDMAGLMALQHKVDALLLFSLDKKGVRTLRVEKNRNGAAPLEEKYEMTKTGLVKILDRSVRRAKEEKESEPEEPEESENEESQDSPEGLETHP